MNNRIKLFLVDDHDHVRTGMRRLLEFEPDIDVVGEANNAADAMRQIRLLNPDVVLMDIKMPGTDGLQATKELQGEHFPGKVVILSAYEQYLPQALEAGAAGFLVKGAKAQEVVSAIHRVHDGIFVFGASIMGTEKGQDIALRHLAGPYEESLESSTSTVVDDLGSWEAVKPGIVVGNVEVVISPPLRPSQLLSLQRWLTEVAHAEIAEVIGAMEQDTIVAFSLERPIPLLKMLGGLSYVLEVTQEPYSLTPQQLTALRIGHIIPTRFRVVLRAE